MLTPEEILSEFDVALGKIARLVDIKARITSMIDVVPDAYLLDQVALRIVAADADATREAGLCRTAASLLEDGLPVPETEDAADAALMDEMASRMARCSPENADLYRKSADHIRKLYQ